jgi:thiol-disulfide isomerase/thioredoxin
MNKFTRFLLAPMTALATGLCLTASAATTLNVGDPAPKLQTGKFVQGDAVTEFAPGKAYIVEFWATWCGPCKVSIPHLNEIHSKFKDQGLIVIGQDCWEQDESKVVPFVKEMGEKMTYRIALDDKDGSKKGKMSDTWMTAAGRNGIPSAFVIDTTGHVAWIGHPMSLKPKIITDVLAGKFDGKEYAAAEEKEKSELDSLKRKVQAAVKDKDWDKAAGALDEVAKLAEDDENLMNYVAMTRFSVFVGKKDFPAAFNQARQMGERTKDNALYQNLLALMLTTDESVQHPDLDLALTLSKRAVDKAPEPVSKALYLDTLARVQFMKGNKDEAVNLEQKALELAAKNTNIMATIQKGLDSYKQGELPEPTWKRSKPVAAKAN